MSTLIVIPARYQSSRFPGKPLAPLKGATGETKSLIHRSWEAACSVGVADKVVVATDDDRIANAVSDFGGETVMTSSACLNGTERCGEAYKNLGQSFDVVVNLQGDAPLTPAWFVEELVEGLLANTSADMATPVLRCDVAALTSFKEDRRAGRVGGTTAVFGTDHSALYFSKEVIPYCDDLDLEHAEIPVFHHVGVYAYRPHALEGYCQLPPGKLELREGLEQLRFIENQKRVLCVEVESRGRQFWELNNPEDTPRIERMMAEIGMK